MSDAPRCEPPEELRGVDGWHWVDRHGLGDAELLAWRQNPSNEEFEWWYDRGGARFISGESKTASYWTYISPVLTPAEAAALRAERDAFQREAAWRENDQRSEAAKWATESATLRARVAVLEGALRDIISDAAVPQELYDRNGPTWTGKDGHEYADMSYVLDKCAELSDTARAALSPTTATTPASELRDGDHPV